MASGRIGDDGATEGPPNIPPRPQTVARPSVRPQASTGCTSWGHDPPRDRHSAGRTAPGEPARGETRFLAVYWAWWIAWAPFVGTFIARVSRGRTIREFIVGVLVAPSLFGFLWFAVFGGTALELELFRGTGLAAAAESDITTALFLTLEELPLGTVLSVVATLLIVTFFITSADSATFVLGMLTSDGSLHPSNRIKLTWGLLQSAIAAVLLTAGGLQGLQTASIIAAAPFALIMLLVCASLFRSLREEGRALRAVERERRRRIDALLERDAAAAGASDAAGGERAPAVRRVE